MKNPLRSFSVSRGRTDVVGWVRQRCASRRVWRWTLVAVAVLAVFGLLGFFAAPPIIRSQLQTRLTAALDRPVSIGTVHFNPYTLRLQLDRLHIPDRDGHAPFVDVDRMVVNASWMSLFRLAPVLDALTLQKPQIHVTRTAPQRFNFSDLVDKFAGQPSPPDAKPLRFALSNIRISDGSIAFDDAVTRSTHRIDHIELGIPFLANLPSASEVYVQPLLAMNVDGSPLRVDGRTRPFADNHESTVDFRLDRLDLARYFAYVPATLPVTLPSGLLSGELTVHFVQARPTPQLLLTGTLQLDDFALGNRSGQAILELGRGTATLADVQPLQSRYAFGTVALDHARLHYVAGADGHSNFDGLVAAPASPGSTPQATPTDLRMASLTLADSSIRYADAGGGKADLDNLHGSIQGLGTLAAVPAKLDVAAQGFDGELALKGNLDLAKSTLTAGLNAQQLKLAPLQAAAGNGLAARVAKGKLDASGQLQLSWGGPFNLHLAQAHATISGFALAPAAAGRGSPLAWNRLDADISQVDLAAQTAQLGMLKVSGLAVDAERARNQHIDLVELFAGKQSAAKKPAANNQPWHWRVAQLVFDQSTLAFTDLAAGDKPVKIEAKALSGSLEDLSDKLDRPSAVKLAGKLGRGSFSVSGKLQPMPVLADLELDTRHLNIAALEPYLSVPLNVTISSALVSSQGKLHYDGRHAEPRLTYRGNAALERVRIQDKLTGDDFLRWRTLSGSRLDVAYGEGVPRLHVGSLVLSSFYARMIVNANGTLNLSEVVANPAAAPVSVTRANNEQPAGATVPAAAAPLPAPAASPATPTAATAPAADVHVGDITLVNGQLNYTDNFIKPNYTANLTQLTGKIGAFGTTPGEPPAELSVQAALNDQSPVDIDGTINPLQPEASLDIKGKANDVELTGLSAYSTRYTGYPITAGKLTVDVHYLLDQRKLKADNHIFITQLSFGDRNESPGIQHLPVKLAVALLRDTHGNIDVNVPVSGSLDDPQFSMGGLIWRALGNLIAKAATAPFRLLGAAFGGSDHEDLGYVAFAPGSAVLDKDAQERLGRIVAMLDQKTTLNLDITGRVDPAKDRDGLRKVTVEDMVRRAKLLDQDGKHADTSEAALATVKVTPDEYDKYLRRAYKSDDFKGKPKNFIGLKKSLPPDEMRSLMETNVPVDAAAMRALAQRRAAAVQVWLEGKLDARRIALKPPVLDASGIDDKGATTRVAFGLHQG